MRGRRVAVAGRLGGPGRGRSRPRAGAIAWGLLAWVLVAAVGPVVPAWSPLGTAPVARAAEGIEITTAARYAVEPAERVVRVAVDVTARNTSPDRPTQSGTLVSYFERVAIVIHDEARRVTARADGRSLGIAIQDIGAARVARIRLPATLYYGQTVTFRLTYDLPGGAPRSASDVRVGPAFAIFYAWAFGDAGTVEVRVPAGFAVTDEAVGGDFERASGPDGITLRVAVADAVSWYAAITATDRDALATERLELDDGEVIVVRGWPEDREWRARVGDLLQDGVPALGDAIGLAWPVRGPLVVVEVHAPLLEGYAGFYDLAEDEITVSEDLDDLTILHEASHAWFNDRLFAERWIYEGLADEYASLVLAGVGGERERPEPVSATDPAAFPLVTWGPPAPIRDEDALARERFGYNAAWTVMHTLATRAGSDGMRAVFRAAQDRTIAYVGEGAPERDNRVTDWRRLLDLVEELGGVTGGDALFRAWVVDAAGARELDARSEARAAYAELVEAGDGWTPPIAVRLPMAAWRFDDATAAITDAGAVLAERDAIASLAAANGLRPPGGLEEAYESAARDFDAAADLAADRRTVLEEVIAAGQVVGAERDWLTALGIDGAQPEDVLAVARTAWEEGELEAATGRAAEATTLIARAPDVGRMRLLAIGAATAAATVVLVAVALVVRRRRRVAAPAGGSGPLPMPSPHPAIDLVAAPDAPAMPGAPDGDAEPGGPYATLAGGSGGPDPGPPPSAEQGGTPT